MVDLTSVRNPAVKELRRLARSRRRGDERLLVEAPGPVEAAVAAGVCAQLFVTDEAARAHPDLVSAARAADARVRTVTPAVLGAMAATRSPQGVVGLARRPLPSVAAALSRATLAVVAVGCADPGNVGTLVRTADAAGADAVVVVGGADPLSPKAVRSSAGSLFHLPVADGDWDAVTAAARDAGLPLVAADAGGPVVHYRRDWVSPAAVVLGSEAHGLPGEVAAACDEAVFVPLAGHAESLNVAVAGAVVLYEAARQRAVAGADLVETVT